MVGSGKGGRWLPEKMRRMLIVTQLGGFHQVSETLPVSKATCFQNFSCRFRREGFQLSKVWYCAGWCGTAE